MACGIVDNLGITHERVSGRVTGHMASGRSTCRDSSIPSILVHSAQSELGNLVCPSGTRYSSLCWSLVPPVHSPDHLQPDEVLPCPHGSTLCSVVRLYLLCSTLLCCIWLCNAIFIGSTYGSIVRTHRRNLWDQENLMQLSCNLPIDILPRIL
jgi:hypothetical protein